MLEFLFMIYGAIGTTASLKPTFKRFRKEFASVSEHEEIIFTCYKKALNEVTGKDLSKFRLSGEVAMLQDALAYFEQFKIEKATSSVQRFFTQSGINYSRLTDRFKHHLTESGNIQTLTHISLSILNRLQQITEGIQEIKEKQAPDLASFYLYEQKLSRHRLSLTNSSDFELVCRKNNIKALSHLIGDKSNLSKKYIPELFVDRQELRLKISEFLASDKVCFAVIGQAGVGKTNFLCDLAYKSRINNVLTLFFDAGYLSDSLERTMSSVFRDSEFEKLSLESIIHHTKSILQSENKQLLIIIDAINEASLHKAFRIQLPTFLDTILASEGAIKILISCRDIDWSYFTRGNQKLCSHIFQTEVEINQDSIRTNGSMILDLFETNAFPNLWQPYKKTFKLLGRPSHQIKKICRHPLMMRFLAETYEGRKIPKDISRLEILEHYWERKISASDTASSIRELLFDIVSQMRVKRKNVLPSDTVEKLTGHSLDSFLSILTRALSENVIRYLFYLKYTGHSGRQYIGFAYETFQEYTLAKSIYWYSDWDSKSTEKILDGIKQLQYESNKYRTLTGTIEFLVLMCEGRQDNVISTLISHLLNSETRWQSVACKVLAKLKSIDKSILKLYDRVAENASWQRRKDYALALASKLSRNEFVIRKIKNDLANCHTRLGELARKAAEYPIDGLSLKDKESFRLINSKVNTYAWMVNYICRENLKLAESFITDFLKCADLYSSIFPLGGTIHGDSAHEALWKKTQPILDYVLKSKGTLSKKSYKFIARLPNYGIGYICKTFLREEKNHTPFKSALWDVLKGIKTGEELPEVQIYSILEIAEWQDQQIFDYLYYCLVDNRVWVRKEAMKAFAVLGNKDASPSIKEAITTSSEEMWLCGIEALTKLNASEFVIPTLEFLANRNEFWDTVDAIISGIPWSMEVTRIGSYRHIEFTLRFFMQLLDRDSIIIFLKSELENACPSKSHAINWLLKLAEHLY